jgi:hypothetical protein
MQALLKKDRHCDGRRQLLVDDLLDLDAGKPRPRQTSA